MAKHVVILPGAWHGPFFMDEVNKRLEAQGYTIYTRQLPAIGNPNPGPDLSEDFTATQSLVDEAIGPNGNDVIVICHSWGGVLASGALAGYGKADREKEGKKGGVVRIGYMTAFIIDEGGCLNDWIMGGGPPKWFGPKKDGEDDGLFHVSDPYILYNDLPEDQQKYWHTRLQTHPPQTFTTRNTSASWKTIPISYLVCEDDLAIPVQGQDAMIAYAREKGVEVQEERIKASHSPFLSMPDETAAWIRRVAGEKV